MAQYADREHYLPVRKSELIDLLCKDKSLSTGQALSPHQQGEFRKFATILSAYYHYEFHARLEQLKEAYAPFDPDRETKMLVELTEAQRQKKLEELYAAFDELLQRGNFQRLTREQINAATREVSAWGLNMDVDFSVFDRLEIYVRGDVKTKRSLRRLWKPWVVEELNVPTYQRLALILKQRQHRRLGRNADTRSVFVKLFKDIPKVDMEMLLPGGRPKMAALDRGKLGASLASAIGFASWKIIQDFGTLGQAFLTRNPLALYGPISLVLGYGYKQWAGYQYQKKHYTTRLAESLYYQNLDSNAGVLTRLLDEAEEQDCREALLAYFYLWRYGNDNGWTADQLDDYAEIDLEHKINLKFDFEVDDALAKLEKLHLVRKIDDRYVAIPIQQALATIDEVWDNIFPYNAK